jgi:hypothetical protein
MLLLALLALAAGAPAPADPCRPEGDQTACYVAHQAHYLAAFGLPDAESRRAAGTQMRRVMTFGRVVQPVVAIEFRRAPGRAPEVAIYGPVAEGAQGLAEPAYAAAIAPAEWERIRTSRVFFDRTLAPIPAEPQPGNVINVCGDGWLDIVETAEPNARSPRSRLSVRVEDTCQHGLANAYARELAEAAARLLPACAALPAEIRFAPTRLAACAKLAGDRMTAAEAYGAMLALRDGEEAEPIRSAFAPDAGLTWADAPGEGPGRAAESWARHLREAQASFFPDRLTGESANRVRVEGHLERWQDEAGRSVLWIAPVTMIVVRSPNDRVYRVTEAGVAAFARARHFCDPDTLAIRCR